MRELLTVGHGTATAEELVARLRGVGVRGVVDIRIAPGSRRNPDVARPALERSLPAAGIGYRWDKRLGGFRRPAPDCPDVALRNESFRGYAGWMRGPEFLEAVDELLAGPAGTAVMCSETVWWRCHRRMVADFVVLARGVAVAHGLPGGRREAHRPTAGVRLLAAPGLLVYDDVAATATTAGRPAAGPPPDGAPGLW